jgi:hypothetical protein
MRHLDDARRAEINAGELEPSDISDLKLASIDEHAARRQIQHATRTPVACSRQQPSRQVLCVGDTRMLAQ